MCDPLRVYVWLDPSADVTCITASRLRRLDDPDIGEEAGTSPGHHKKWHAK